MLVPHHRLHPRRIRLIEQGKGGGGMTEAMHHNAGLLHPYMWFFG